MATIAIAHHRPWTVDEWWELVEGAADADRCELLEGSLLVSPLPSIYHQFAGDRLCARLADSSPEDLVAITAVGVRLGSDTALVPDVTVFRHQPGVLLRGPVEAANTLLVVEIVSPTSKTIDRVAKPAKYAAAGIPNYWLMEIEDGRFEINVLELAGDTYRLAERMLPGVPATLLEPFPIEIDIDRLRLS